MSRLKFQVDDVPRRPARRACVSIFFFDFQYVIICLIFSTSAAHTEVVRQQPRRLTLRRDPHIAQPLVAYAIPRNKMASVAAGDEPETILNFKGQSCMTQFNALFLKVSPLGWATQTRREIGLFPSPLIPPRSSSAPHLSFRSHATTFSRHLFPHLTTYQPPRSDLI